MHLVFAQKYSLPSQSCCANVQVLPDAMEDSALFGQAQAAALPGALQHLLKPVEPQFSAARAAAAAATSPESLEKQAAPCGTQWLVLDGSLQSTTADRLSHLLLGRPIVLNTGARIRVVDRQRLLWECEHLAGASPALLSAAGVCVMHETLQDTDRLLAGVMDSMLQTTATIDKVLL
jgi:hypothetical protein